MPSRTSRTAEAEVLQTLPSGHPQAGYVGPDRSLQDGIGTLPPDEQDAVDEAQAAAEEEAATVAEHENEVASEEHDEALVEPAPAPAKEEKKAEAKS